MYKSTVSSEVVFGCVSGCMHVAIAHSIALGLPKRLLGVLFELGRMCELKCHPAAGLVGYSKGSWASGCELHPKWG